MIPRYVIPLFTIFTALSPILLREQFNFALLLGTGIAFMATQMIHSRSWFHLSCSLICLALFHWSTQMNWAVPLYLLLAGQHLRSGTNQLHNILVLFFSGLIYILIYLNMFGITFESVFKLTYTLLLFAIVNLLAHFHTSAQNQAQMLHEKNTQLSTLDSLTGLLNFEEFHKRLELLMVPGRSLLLILMDCTDLKSMNDSRGFEEGNQLLKQLADLLKQLFPDSYMIARYGGDEFAVLMDLRMQSNSVNLITQRLDLDIPDLTGIHITYGLATYPNEAETKDDLILAAEKNLFSMKRDQWLKREEHLLRAEKLKLVGELASGMAHEIRNPLTTIKGFMQLSKSNSYNVESCYHLIMEEITRMSELTAEFLQFSKPHATRYKVHSLQECIHRVIYLTDSEAMRLGHVIQYSAPVEPVMILMDQDKIVQLMLNLVKNSFEAMGKNGVIQIDLSVLEQHGVIIIKDNGEGIPSEQLNQAFHPFYTSKMEGTGLGLSICHKIVQDHNGIIGVESILNVGTTFTITFPLESLEQSMVK